MIKNSFIKHFKTVVACTVILMMTFLLVTVHPAQAGPVPPIFSTDDDAILTLNYGDTITTTGDYESGIYSSGDGSTITNNGTIITRGNYGHGIYGFDDYFTVTNNGTITTTGEYAIGIETTGFGDYFTVTNNGTITTTKYRALGIQAVGFDDYFTVINNGTITTTGNVAHGIYAWGSSSKISNYGSISVTGPRANGIWVRSGTGETSTINNGGFISATGEDSYAIKGKSGEDTLNLFSGSDIRGNIDLGGGNDILTAYSGSTVNGNVNLGAGDDKMTVYQGARFNGPIDFGAGTDTLKIHPGNYALTFEDLDKTDSHDNPRPENIITDPSLLAVLSGNTIMTVDKTGQSVKGPVLSSLCNGLHGVIHKRLTHFKPELIKLATTRIEPGMLVKPKQPQAWGDVFRSYRKRDDDRELFAYDHEYRGFTGGFERTYKRFHAGVMGGFSRANVEADSESFRTDSNSYFTGIYGQYDFGRYKLSASMIGGYEDHDNDRYVTDNVFGSENARADFGSIFLSPSVTLRADYTVAHRILLRPSATMMYSAGWYDEYHEHGTTRSNLTIDDRTLQSLNGNLKLAAIYMLADVCELQLSAAGTARYTDDGSVDGNLGGSGFRFAATNDDSVYGGQLGAYLGVDVSDRLNLYVNAEFSEASGDETQDFFMAGLKFNF